MHGVPKTMRAAALDRFGGPDVLTIHEVPVPSVEGDEVLIKVHTAGVGSWDADMRAGWWPDGAHPPFPIVLGTDGSGIVVQMGPRSRRFNLGDKVYAYSFANKKGGFYAEYVSVPAFAASPIPAVLDMSHAGAAACIGLTALQGIDDALHVKPDERVVIHGASGGVGHLAVQFAKLREARVLGTARGADALAFVRRLGADAVADPDAEDLLDAARRFAPDGVDAVLALVGGGSLMRILHGMPKGGRLAFPNGVERVPGKWRGIDIVSYDAKAGVKEFKHLDLAVQLAKLKVNIAKSYPLAQASKAHERLAEGHVLGKVTLRADRGK